MRSASGSVGHSQGSSSSGVPVMHVEGRLRMVETMCGRTDTLCDRLEQVVEIHRQAIERLNAGAAEQKVLLEKRQPVSAARLDDLHDAVQKQDRQHRGSMAALLERVDAVERHHRSLDELHRRVAQYEKQNKAMYAEVLDRVESVESFKKSVGDVYKAIDAKDASQRTAYRTLAERVDSVEHSASNILDVRESLEKHERSVKASVRGLSERVEALEHREAAVDALNERMYQVDKAAKTALGDVKDRLGDLETSLTGLTEETVKVMVGRVEKVEKKVDVLTRQQDADRDAVVEWKDVQGEAARRLQVDVKTAEASARQCHVDTTELTAHVQSFTTLRQDVELLAAKLKEETPKRESAVVAMTARLDSMEETVSEHSIVLAAASGATASTLSAPPSMTSSIDAPRQLGFVGLNLSDTTQNAAAQRGKHKLVCGLVNNMEVVALKQSVTALAQHVEALDTKLHGYVEAGLAGLAKKVEKTVATMLGTSVEACDKQAVAAEAKMAASLDGINQRVEQRLRNAEACAEERFARTKTALQEVSGLFDAARAEVAAVAERLDAASPTRHRFITALDSRVTTVVGKLEKLETALQESTRSAAPARITTVDAAAQQQLLQSLATRCSFIERTIRSLQDQITDTRNAAMLLGPAGGLRSGSATPTNGAGRSTSQLSEPRRHISITPTESSVLGSVRGAATVKYDFPSAFAPETAPLTSNSTSTPSASTMNGDRVGSPLRSAAKPFVDLLDGLQEADDKRRGSLGLARCPSLRSLIG
eukprot:TRINITY_DN22169_c0_g1_i1.p1 TRINITY_DN22169_c0_g1~~TRINITY_DN22169_c0_g1_i1.p1  ORF type:complete len:766 (+),score=215.97 TRINITY_DN22169_c0_g1_i1:72-2369(+)